MSIHINQLVPMSLAQLVRTMHNICKVGVQTRTTPKKNINQLNTNQILLHKNNNNNTNQVLKILKIKGNTRELKNQQQQPAAGS